MSLCLADASFLLGDAERNRLKEKILLSYEDSSEEEDDSTLFKPNNRARDAGWHSHTHLLSFSVSLCFCLVSGNECDNACEP